MKNIRDNILQFIKSKTVTGCLQIKGDWGSGKTYFVNNVIVPELKKDEYSKIPVILSLFGLSSVKDIHFGLLNSYINAMNDLKKSITDDMNRGLDYLDLKYGSNKAIFNFNLRDDEELIYKIIPKENVVLFLDDVERFINKDNVEELMGVINNLVEVRGYKVIIIYNDNYMKNNETLSSKSDFKEKVIDYVVKYSPSFDEKLNILVKSFDSEEFNEFFKKEKAIGIFNPENYPTEYRKHFSNLRIIRSILSTFFIVFQHYKDFLDKDKRTELKLLYYLTFIVGTSIEFKTDKISDADCHNLNVYTDNFDNIDLGYNEQPENILFDDTEEDEEEKKERKLKNVKDNQYAKSFYKRYVKKFNQNIVFHPQLYNHITTGCEIDFVALDCNLLDCVSEFSEDICPGNIIVDEMLKGLWLYDDNNFTEDLTKLLEYTEKGELKKCVYYANATYILLRFKEITGLNDDELKDKIKGGIDLYFSKNKIENDEKLFLQHAFGSNNWAVEYMINKIDEQNDIYSEEAIDELQRLFINDMEQFADRFKDGKYHRSDFYNTSILEHICNDEVAKKMAKLTPNEVYILSEFIEQRYKPEFANNLNLEILFLNFIKKALEVVPKDNKKLSTNLINKILKPKINEAIKIISKK